MGPLGHEPVGHRERENQMDARDVFLDGFGRVKDFLHESLEGLSQEDLVYRAEPKANTIAWLAWHLSRVQDDHVAEVAKGEQVWLAAGWSQNFGLHLDPWDTGYGHKAPQVAEVQASADMLLGYHDDVYKQTRRYLNGLTATALDAVVDKRFDPPVTLGVRLMSVIADDLQHVGQIGYVRGLLQRRPG